MKDNDLQLVEYIKIADIQASRLEMALAAIRQYTPFTLDQLNNLNNDVLAFLDMMTTRFAKLQDIIGKKIFPAILTSLIEDCDADSFIDKLDRLEKINYLHSANWWIGLKDVRNSITHDYPSDLKVMSVQLNSCIAASKELLSYWTELKAKMQSAKLI